MQFPKPTGFAHFCTAQSSKLYEKCVFLQLLQEFSQISAKTIRAGVDENPSEFHRIRKEHQNLLQFAEILAISWNPPSQKKGP